MAYRKTVTLDRQDNGPDAAPLWMVRPGTRAGAWIWFEEEHVPGWAREVGKRVIVERLPGQRRPGWRIVAPA